MTAAKSDDKERDEKMGPWIGDRSVKYLRKIFDEAADACDGDYKEKVAAGMLACYDSGFRTGRYTAPLPEYGTLEFWKNEAGRFKKSAESQRKLAEERLAIIVAAGLKDSPVSTSGRWVPEDEYEALRQLQFYARHPGQENMVVHFLREIEECDKRNAVSARPLNNDTSTTADKP